MAVPLSQEEYRQDLLGQEPVQLSGAVQAPQTGGIQTVGQAAGQPPGGETATATGTNAPSQQAPSGAPAGSLFGASGTTAERLFSPLTSQKEKVSQGTAQLGETFRTAAGPTGQTFESRGGEEAINQAVSGQFGTEADRQAATERARGYVNASYAGPMGLDQAQKGKVAQDIENYRTQANALRSGYGVEALLSQGSPGLTRGEARFEAQQVFQDPEYRKRAALAAQEAEDAAQRLANEERDARSMAAARVNEEKAIQDRARELLQGKKTGIEGDIDAEVKRRQEEQAAQIAAWNKYQETGDVSDLLAFGGVNAEEINRFNSPGAQLEREAQAKYDEILNDPRFASIKEFDPLGLMVSKRGREKYTLSQLPEYSLEGDTPNAPPEYLQAPSGEKPGKQKAAKDIFHQRKAGIITKEQQHLLQERQKALEEAGFAPKTAKNKEAGKYSLVNPLYFGEGVDPADTRAYTEFKPGVSPARQNVSTEEQRNQFNAINGLLDSVERLDAAGEPYRAAQVAADVDRYLSDEEAAFKEAGEGQTASSKKWKKAVAKARDRYKDAQRIGEWGKVVKSVTGSESLGNTVGTIGAGVSTGNVKQAATGIANLPLAMATLPLTSYANPSYQGMGRGQATGMVNQFGFVKPPAQNVPKYEEFTGKEARATEPTTRAARVEGQPGVQLRGTGNMTGAEQRAKRKEEKRQAKAAARFTAGKTATRKKKVKRVTLQEV